MPGILDSNFLDILLAHWEIGPIRSVQPQTPGENVAGNVFFIETEAGASYVLKRKTVVHTRDEEPGLLERLAEQGIPVAVPLRTRAGEAIWHYGDDCFELCPRLPGTVYNDHYGPGAASQARLYGAAIARLHVALQRCEEFVTAIEMDLPGEVNRCGEEIQSIWPAEQPALAPILAALEAGLATYSDALPRQLIHRDAHPANMLFQDGQLSGWLDFEIMLHGPRLFDLGYCATSLLVSGLDDPRKCQIWPSLLAALVAGYESVSPLEPVEHQALKTMLLAIEVIFIAFFGRIRRPGGVALNIRALTWLYQNQP